MRAVKNAVPPWPLCHASPLYRTSGAGRLVRDEESSTGPAVERVVLAVAP